MQETLRLRMHISTWLRCPISVPLGSYCLLFLGPAVSQGGRTACFGVRASQGLGQGPGRYEGVVLGTPRAGVIRVTMGVTRAEVGLGALIKSTMYFVRRRKPTKPGTPAWRRFGRSPPRPNQVADSSPSPAGCGPATAKSSRHGPRSASLPCRSL